MNRSFGGRSRQPCDFFMFTLVLSANLFSDVVRDAFDPRLRSSR